MIAIHATTWIAILALFLLEGYFDLPHPFSVPLTGFIVLITLPFIIIPSFRAFMKAIIICILSCLSVFAVDTSDIRVVTWTYKIRPEDSLATVEVFTRSGQTNLVRNTHTKDGVVLFRSQSFYHDGTEVGSYIYQIANGTNTLVGSTPGTPYYFDLHFESSSNRPRSAHSVPQISRCWTGSSAPTAFFIRRTVH